MNDGDDNGLQLKALWLRLNDTRNQWKRQPTKLKESIRETHDAKEENLGKRKEGFYGNGKYKARNAG
jgi:hypothetical protein